MGDLELGREQVKGGTPWKEEVTRLGLKLRVNSRLSQRENERLLFEEILLDTTTTYVVDKWLSRSNSQTAQGTLL